MIFLSKIITNIVCSHLLHLKEKKEYCIVIAESPKLSLFFFFSSLI